MHANNRPTCEFAWQLYPGSRVRVSRPQKRRGIVGVRGLVIQCKWHASRFEERRRFRPVRPLHDGGYVAERHIGTLARQSVAAVRCLSGPAGRWHSGMGGAIERGKSVTAFGAVGMAVAQGGARQAGKRETRFQPVFAVGQAFSLSSPWDRLSACLRRGTRFQPVFAVGQAFSLSSSPTSLEAYPAQFRILLPCTA